MFFQDKYRYNFISTFLLFETKVGCNYVVHWETDQETSRVYRLERDVFISNEADSLFCNTADLGRQEEGERAFFLEKHPVELTEYALGQEVLVSTLFLPPTDTYGDVYLTTFFFFFLRQISPTLSLQSNHFSSAVSHPHTLLVENCDNVHLLRCKVI